VTFLASWRQILALVLQVEQLGYGVDRLIFQQLLSIPREGQIDSENESRVLFSNRRCLLTHVSVLCAQGDRRRKQLASFHRPSSTAVAIETAIQHGTRLRLPGRYNPNPLPPSKPQPSARIPEPSSGESERSTRLEESSRDESTSRAESASKEILGDQTPGASSQFEALQAQLAAMERERDALRAKVSKLEGSSDKPPRKSPVESETSVRPAGQEQGEFRDVNKRPVDGKGVQNGVEDSARGRPKTRSMALGLQPPVEVTAGNPETVNPVQMALPTKDGPAAVPPPLESEPSTSSISGASLRPSFLRRPAPKRDFFQAPTRVTLQSPIKPSVSGVRKSSTDSAAVPSPARQSRASGVAGSGVHYAAESLKGPAVTRSRSFSANPASSPSPAQNPRPSPVPASPKASQTSLPRYQSFLRKPSAKGASGVGQPRTLKSGAFSSSAIQAACAVPLPPSPGMASPSPIKKPAARAHAGAITPSSPAASRLRRSGDKPPTNPSPSGTSKLPSGTNKGSAPEGPKTAGAAPNTFMSKLAAASGSQSRIPALGSSRLKPPGLKPPAKPSALPRPSSIDPAILAAACAVPLPGSPKPRSLLPRGTSGTSAAAIAAACAVPLPTSPKKTRPSRLRPPLVVTVALVKAACAVPLPPSPKSKKTTKPSQPAAEQSPEAGGKRVKEIVSKEAGGGGLEERENLGAKEEIVRVPAEVTGREGGKSDSGAFESIHTGDAAARVAVDALSTNKSLLASKFAVLP
jgi:hypothetical protein